MKVEDLFRNSLDELEKLLSSKSVVGEPITVNGTTIIPLLSTGFGFGAGGGTQPTGTGEGSGGGTGAGGGIKPVAVVIIDHEGVRVAPITPPSALDRLGDAAARVIESQGTRLGRSKTEPAPQE